MRFALTKSKRRSACRIRGIIQIMRIKILAVSLLAVLILCGGAGVSIASETGGTIDVGVQTGMQGVIKSAPIASPAAGNFHATTTVSLSASGSTAICYTTNGITAPACSGATSCFVGTKYFSAISVASATTIRGVACYTDGTSGPTSSDAYTFTCETAVVSHGTVADYPSCAITCSSGYYKSGNSCLVSGGGTPSGGGGGGSVSDTTAPTISNIIATPTSGTTATVTWQTNEGSLSWILYGTSTAYGQQIKTSVYTASHSIALTNLIVSTTYHYQVKSQDSLGNVGTFTDKTFTTLTVGQTASGPSTGGSSSSTVTQMTREQLIALIIRLIASMTAGGSTTGTGTPGSSFSGIPSGFTFQNNLAFGMDKIDVKYLQIVLNSNADTKIALTGAGSPGYETTRFGSATLAAVKKFQTKYGIVGSTSSAYGLVGPATRAKLNSLLGR